ncbi:uncharacterized protein LOC135106656 [Scylla paramamosain]|uniref:uncharacterized protein LOC135106656 n=1 Tax=Scylla paramamosain TaxID=85552 RepID=UPI0030833331
MPPFPPFPPSSFPHAAGVEGLDCFKCGSVNGSDPQCSDPFHHNHSTTYLASPCLAGWKGREGAFPATHCVKLSGYFYQTGESMFVRGCTTDSGTLTVDTELGRQSHCGVFLYDDSQVHHLPVAHVAGVEVLVNQEVTVTRRQAGRQSIPSCPQYHIPARLSYCIGEMERDGGRGDKWHIEREWGEMGRSLYIAYIITPKLTPRSRLCTSLEAVESKYEYYRKEM